MEKIELQDGRIVLKQDYIKAKTRVLKEFGYETLTEEAVTEQLEKLINNEELSVIGMFMKADILIK